MKTWKRSALSTLVLTVGVVTGGQSVHAFDKSQPKSVAVSSTSSANGTQTQNQAGPRPIDVVRVGTLTFAGTPSITSTTAHDAVAPVMVGRNVGYAAMNGSILKTTDGGKTFHPISSLPDDVQSLTFTSPSMGFAVTQSGGENMTANQTIATYSWSIYRTTNGGKTWTKVWAQKATQTPPTYASSNDHVYLFGNTGYAIVSGHALRTANGGKTWQPMRVSGTPLDVQALGANNVWMAVTDAKTQSDGSTGQGTVQLLHSTDGGQHFASVVKAPNVTLWEAKVSFDGKGNGILLVKDLSSWSTTVFWTTDGGKTWKSAKPDAYQGRIAQSQPVWGSSGKAWIALDPGAAPFPGGMTQFDVASGKVTQVAQIGDWRDAEIGAVNDETIFAEASLIQGKAIVKSTDGGKTWDQVYPMGEPNTQVRFATSTFGLGLGSYGAKGYIYRTSDGGKHWEAVKTLQGIYPSAIAFVNRDTAYVSAYTSPAANSQQYGIQMFVTHNGGTSWSKIATSTASLPNSVTQGMTESTVQTVLSANDKQLSMYIDTAYPSSILTSVDAGHTWNQVATWQSSLSLDTAAYVNPSNLWVADVTQNHVPTKTQPSVYTSTIYQLTQGSSATSVQKRAMWTLPTGWMILGMDRVNQQDAYVYATRSLADMSQGAAVFATHDGGKTWTEWKTSGSSSAAKVPMPLNLFPSGAKIDMSFATPEDGYMLTANGLLKTTNGGSSWTYVH